MLPLPITPETLLREVITTALGCLPPEMESHKARVMLLAIAMQESGLRSRWQVLSNGSKGAARGLWMFEQGTEQTRGGVWGVYLHKASRENLRLLCFARECDFTPKAIWRQIEEDDILAAGVARLLLWTDPLQLPSPGNEDGAWLLYMRTWRPGRPHPRAWRGNYATAMAAAERRAGDRHD